jgi:3-dehydroquinate synthase II
MKELWLRLDPNAPQHVKTDLLKQADGRCRVVVLDPEDMKLASNLKLKVASNDPKADIKLVDPSHQKSGRFPSQSAVQLVVKDSADEANALDLAGRGAAYLIIRCPNWKIIPFENLISKRGKETTLLADVSTVSDAKIALQTLELGVDGVVLSPNATDDILEMDRFLREMGETLPLVKARVTSVKPLGSGARVCVDSTELMRPGEGMLVGSQSSGLFLVEAEVHKNPHVEPRPFRVNAGPVSSYVLTPGLKTRYLSELRAGDGILVVDRSGSARPAHVARIKIELRPLMLVEAETDERNYAIILQNAETVRLMSSSSSKSVSEIKPGDEVMVRIEHGGRHFGTLVAGEMVIER